MKKLKLLYNPLAGDRTFPGNLDACIGALQSGGYEVHVFRSQQPGDIENHIAKMHSKHYDAVVICGGDGSISRGVNAMLANGVHVPLGIIPSGTANDFATHFAIPQDHAKAAALIARGRVMPIDIGQVNDHYFINVCAAGLFSGISQSTDLWAKNTFGKLAYYLKGVEQLPNFVPVGLKIQTAQRTIEDKFTFFCVLNSSGAGGFDKLAPGASVVDGYLDFVAFRGMPLLELPLVFVKVLSGEHLEDDRVVYIRDKQFQVEPLEDTPCMFLGTDLDGEAGPNLPVNIQCLPGAIQLFIP